MVPPEKAGDGTPSCVVLVGRGDELTSPPAGFLAAAGHHAIPGRPTRLAASLLTGFEGRADLDDAAPRLTELAAAAGVTPVVASDEPAPVAAGGWTAGPVDVLADDGLDPVARLERWLEGRAAGPFFALVWRSGRSPGAVEAVVAALARRGRLESTAVIALGTVAAGDGPPGLVPAPLLVAPSPALGGRGLHAGPSAAVDVAATVVDVLAIPAPPFQGRSLLGGADVPPRPLLVEGGREEDLALAWTAAVDGSWTYTRVEGWGRALTAARVRALLTRPAWRRPLLAALRGVVLDRRVALAGAAPGPPLTAAGLTAALGRWEEEREALARAAARWRGDDAALRHRLRGLGYLA